MAKKGKKFNKYTIEFRNLVISDVLKFGQAYATRKHKINVKTVDS